MPELAKETVALLTFLIPGFLVGWVLYGLTSYQKPAQLERIIQALIFTLFVKAAVALLRELFELFGSWGFSIGEWNGDVELAWSLIAALLIGLVVASAVNRDSVHDRLRKWGLSSRDSHSSEWLTVFNKRSDRFVVLNLDDGRRLYGWPKIWPSDPFSGHFFITHAAWLHSNSPTETDGVEGVLIESKRVVEIEFVKRPDNDK
jgi:hypothetical protein